MNKIKKQQVIKIPHNINLFYSKKKKLLVVKGITNQKSFKLHKWLTLSNTGKHLEIKSDNTTNFSNNNKKKIRLIQKTTISLIKQLLVETNAPMYQKLKFVGVGYRASLVENFENYLLLLRLGYSHPIYFKIPQETKVFSLKLTKLFLSGYSFQKLTSAASKIRLNKIPEPYKGKGILYENEKIILKEGKKI
jgi:large subunit ribosomal protein L6